MLTELLSTARECNSAPASLGGTAVYNHHKSGGRVNHGFRMSFHGCVTIRDVIIDVM